MQSMRTLSCLAIAMLAPTALAQCFDQAYGTPIGTAATLYGDVVFPIRPIGFAFPIGAATYTDVHICDKGYVYLSNAGVPAPGVADFTATAAELASGPPRICALWSDIQVLASNNGQIYINSSPAQCTITWINAQTYSATSGLFNMQMQLQPTGQVKVLYGPGTTNASTQLTWWAGVAGLSPGLGAPLPAASDLSVGGVTTDNTLYEEWLAINTFDMANNGLLILPTSPGYVYLPIGTPVNCASVSDYGTGCGTQNDSIYEQFAPTAFDLGGTTLTYLRQPGGYTVLNSVAGTFVPPSGAATIVANADDTEQVVALTGSMPVPGGVTSSLTVCSNGRIALGGTGNGTAYTPDGPTFLAFANATIAASWHDYNPTIAGSGSILFEQIGSIAYVTWNGVYSYGTTVPDTFQYQFDVTSGSVTVVYGTFSTQGNDRLAGYSPGGPSTASPSDLSALTAPVFCADSSAGLALTTNGGPTLGNSSFALVSSNIPSLVPIGLLFFGDTAVNPGIDLTFLGMPGCFGYTNANLTSVTFPVIGASGSVNLPIPSSPGLIGLSLACQSLAFSLVTPSNLITSNGTQFTIGN
jgi:hypothetical protein